MNVLSRNGFSYSDAVDDNAMADSSQLSPTDIKIETIEVAEEDGPMRRSPAKGRDIKPCKVCDDKALGYNFDAISCESCKAFFRRNALKEKYPKCVFNGNCTITPQTRRFCSACRLKKCFGVGMKKHMILGEEERKRRNQKVKTNREKKFSHTAMDTVSSTSSVTSTSIKCEATSYSIPSTYSPVHHRPDIALASLLGIPSALKLPQVDLSQLNYSPQSPLPNCRALSLAESQYIAALHHIYYLTYGSTEEESVLSPEGLAMEGLINHIGKLVKFLIKFAKKLPDFTELSQKIQIGLLKGNLMDCVAWRSAQIWNVEAGNWLRQDGKIVKSSILTSAFSATNPHLKDQHVELITAVKNCIKDDMTLFPLMVVISLFSSLSLDSFDKQEVADIQDKFVILLRHYLQSKYCWSESNEMFSEMMQHDDRIRRQTAEHAKAFLSADTGQVEPLLLEVLNL